MLRKVLFLALALALVFAVSAPIGLSANNHVSDNNTTLVASVYHWDTHFAKADPECTPPTGQGC